MYLAIIFYAFFLIPACASAENVQIDFSATKYMEDRSVIQKMFRTEFAQEARMRKERGLAISEADIGIDKYDLNGDGRKEIFVLLKSPYFCGASRCQMKVFQTNEDLNWNSILEVSTNDIVAIAPTDHNGFRDIIIGGGVIDESVNVWKWNGKKYIHSEIN